MKLLHVKFDQAGIEPSDYVTIAKRCEPEIERVKKALHTGYESEYASINLPFDQQMRHDVMSAVNAIGAYHPTMLIIIGIGGSNLGTMAVAQALFGINNQSNSQLQIYYVDTVDPDAVSTVKSRAEHELKSGHVVIVNIVTKSGTTTETIANGSIFIELLMRYCGQSYKDYVVVTTDFDSPLWDIAKKQEFRILGITKNVGGRYSVMSAVGLFPLALMGIDIEALHQGAASMVNLCAQKDWEHNSAALSAAILYAQYQEGFVIHNFFPFSVDLQGLGLWYRQLMAESLGKEFNRKNEPVHTGITPAVSVGTTDLHSIVELYLGGPRNTFTTFVEVESTRSQLDVPAYAPFAKLVPHIQGKSLSTIMHAILEGTKDAYLQQQRPFMSVTFPEKSAEVVGQFMQWKMLEIIYLGYLFGISPFVQPQVELYKKKARMLLEQS